MKNLVLSNSLHSAINRSMGPEFRLFVFIILGTLVMLTGCKKMNNETLQTADSPSGQSLDLQLIVDNLVSPVNLVEAPDSSKRLFVVDQIGKIWIIGADGKKKTEPFIDLSSKIVSLSPGYDERGLLGLAFHPDYMHNGRFFVFYSATPAPGGPAPAALWDNKVRISEFHASAGNPDKADPGPEKIILEVNHPQANHNGGTIAFGPDGYLYVSIGDGGNSDDVGPGHVSDWYKVNEGGNGQDVASNLLGNILRIDINCQVSYKIPNDNPFVGKKNILPEIYAYGFRNPYRFSFDMGGTHQLYAGDAGQSLYEEIDIVTKGGNYGWNVKEGTHCFSTANDLMTLAACPIKDSLGNQLVDPIIELPNAANPAGGLASVIVAGHVYRGKAIKNFDGQYVFGIFSQGGSGGADGKLLVSTPGGSGLLTYADIPLKSFPNNLGQYVKGFGQSFDGEIYVLTTGVLGPSGTSGKVYKLTTAAL
jgi:glucose/arabinose dehydrogenase